MWIRVTHASLDELIKELRERGISCVRKMNRIQNKADPVPIINVWVIVSAKDAKELELHEWRYLLFSGHPDIETKWIPKDQLARMDGEMARITAALGGFRILDGRYQLAGEDVLHGEL